MATAKKTKEGSWRVLAYVGKTVTKSGYKSFTASTKKEAERLALDFTAQRAPKELLTVREAIRRYVSSRENTLSPATVKGYNSILRTALPDIMPLALTAVTPERLQRAFDAQAAAGTSPKTQRNIYGLLAAAAKMFGATLPQVHLLDLQKRERQIPTTAEVKQLLEATQGDLHLAILLAAELGLSRSEVCALTMQDCREDRVRVTKAMVQAPDNSWVIKQPKETSRYRVIPMTPAVRVAIEALPRGPDARVVDITPTALDHQFRRLCARTIGRTCGFHALRHYNVSLMLAAGMKPKYIIDRTGHATMHMVDTVYGHIMQQEKQEEADLFNRYISGL